MSKKSSSPTAKKAVAKAATKPITPVEKRPQAQPPMPQQQQQQRIFALHLAESDLQVIMELLTKVKLPYEVSHPVIAKLNAQISAGLAKQVKK